MNERVLVIGLDGATWDLLRPWMDKGIMPNLKRMTESGASGDLRSVYPPETAAAWPSFMTGKNPGKHGIFDFLVYNPVTQKEGPVNSRVCMGKTLWEYLSDAGKTSLVLNVPTTYPIKPIKGAMISGFLTPAGADDYAYPQELTKELEAEYGRYPLFFSTQQFICAASEYNVRAFLDELEEMDRIKFEVAEKLFDRYTPDLTMLHIWGTDRIQHELWNLFDPEHPKYDARLADKFGPRIEAYYVMVDDRVGRLAEKLGGKGVTFVISDHGFGPNHFFIDQNSWLLREGFIVLKKGLKTAVKRMLWNMGLTPVNATNLVSPFLKFLMHFKAVSPERALRKSTGAISIPFMLNLNDIDWEKTRAYAAPFGWSGIYVNTRGIRPNGSVPPEEYETVQAEIVERWKELVNPITGERVNAPAPINKDMFKGPYARYGGDVMPMPLGEKYMPVCFFGFNSKQPIYESNTLFGHHRMEGILAATGDVVQPGKIEGAGLIDMAPTIFHLLGLPVPDDMDGKPIEDLLPPETRAKHPVETLHVTAEDDLLADGLSAEEEEDIRDKLKGLGYL